MADFGVPTARPPQRVDELIDGALMSRLDAMDVTSRRIFAGKLQGERRSKKRGQSVEFADYRQYAHGDDLRFIDWNVYARLDKLFLKMFLEEEDLSLVVAIDCTASMDFGNPSKFEYARRLAMALGYVGLINQNRVTLYGWDESGVRPLTGLRGRRRTREMGEWLLGLAPRGRGDFTQAMKTIALARQGRGVLCVLSDFLLKEGYEDGIRYLAGGGYDTFCLQLLSPEELDPGRHGLAGDLRLTDVEDDDAAEVTVSAALLERYRRNLEEHCDRLREFCIRRDVMHVRIDTATPVESVLIDGLRKQGLLR